VPNFVTFDDGVNYVAIGEIESFGYVKGPNKGGETLIKLKNGKTYQSSWSVDKIAEFLGPVANLHY
jgi:hypothetical protein